MRTAIVRTFEFAPYVKVYLIKEDGTGVVLMHMCQGFVAALDFAEKTADALVALGVAGVTIDHVKKHER